MNRKFLKNWRIPGPIVPPLTHWGPCKLKKMKKRFLPSHIEEPENWNKRKGFLFSHIWTPCKLKKTKKISIISHTLGRSRVNWGCWSSLNCLQSWSTIWTIPPGISYTYTIRKHHHRFIMAIIIIFLFIIQSKHFRRKRNHTIWSWE